MIDLVFTALTFGLGLIAGFVIFATAQRGED